MRQNKAIRKIKLKAEKGDIKAKFQLYEYYRDGKYVEKNHKISDEYATQVLDLFKDHSLKILNIKLIDFRLFQSIECHFSPKKNITVIVGINGAGKTTILEAIALSLSWLTIRIRRHEGKGKTIDNKNDIRRGERYASIITQLSIDNKNTQYELELSKSIDASQQSSRKNSLMEIRQLGRIYKLANSKNKDFNLPIIAYYPVERSLDIKSQKWAVSKKKMTTQTNKFDGYDESLSGTANTDIKVFFQWFKYCEEIEKFETGFVQKQASKFINETKKAIEVFIPYIKNLRIQRTPYEDMLIDKNGIKLSILQLSQGEKSLLSLIADIIRRLVLLNPSLGNPLSGDGVILIDEIDLHLHPAWQQKVVPSLLRTFPNIQFILTTHSPQVLSTIRKENIRLLSTNMQSESISAIPLSHSYGEPSNNILQSIMDTDPQPPIEEKKDLDELTSLVDQGEYELSKVKKSLHRLKKELGENHPQLAKIERSIRRHEVFKTI